MKVETTTLTQKVIIPASPEEVYEAFVDPKKHSSFTGSKATGKAKSTANLLRGTVTFLASSYSSNPENA